MVELYIPRKDGMYRNHCECGAISESQNVFSDEKDEVEPHMLAFVQEHAGLGHSGVVEGWFRDRWVTGMTFSPLTHDDIDQINAMGGLG